MHWFRHRKEDHRYISDRELKRIDNVLETRLEQ